MTTEKPASAFKENIRAVSRAIQVLNSFADRDLQSLADVSSATGLDKGTTRRLLLTLAHSNYISIDPASNLYRLGRAIHDLAANVNGNRDLRTVARPALLAFASEFTTTTFLSIFKEGAAVCLDRIHDMRGVEVHWWQVGGTLPLDCGGAPKLLLAMQSDEEIERVLSKPMGRLRNTTKSAITEFRQHLRVIRERGWECAIDDVAEGISALAVPILDAEGKLICAVSTAGLTPQFIKDGQPVMLDRLQDTADKIRQQLSP